MQAFLLKLIIAAVTDKEVQKVIKTILAELLAVAVPTAVKSAMDQLIEKVPGIEGVVDIITVGNDTIGMLDRLIPDIDTGNEAIDRLMDFWRPRA